MTESAHFIALPGLREPGKPRLEIEDRHVLIPGEIVDWRITHLAGMLNEYIASSAVPVVYAMVLTGGVDFGMRLKQHLAPSFRYGFLRTSRYSGSEHGSETRLLFDGLGSVKGCRVILVDDIGDERITLQYLTQYLAISGAAEVKTCVMLNKAIRKQVDLPLDFVGFTIPNAFVWGRGLDGGDKTEEKRNDFDVCFSGAHPGGENYTIPTTFPQ